MISLGHIHIYDRNAVVTRPLVVENKLWLEHRAALAEELTGTSWSELAAVELNRRELMDWIERKIGAGESFYADDYTLLQARNGTYWFNRGWDALAQAAGIPRRTRKRLKREREKSTNSGSEGVSPPEGAVDNV
jgi:hypothetical protein